MRWAGQWKNGNKKMHIKYRMEITENEIGW
jgi:hypothetical protein